MEFPSTIDQPSFNSKLQLLAVALVTVTVLIFKLNILSPHRRRNNLPPGSFGFPIFLGESLTFLKALKQNKLDSFFTDRIAKHGPVFKTMLLGSKTVVLTGQAGNRFVFSGGDNGITSNMGVSARGILGKDSVFEISGARHKLVRGAMMNFLKPESLQRFVGEMDSVLKQQLSQELDGRDSVQGVRLIKVVTFKVTCSLLFGLSEGKKKDSLLEDFIIALKGTIAIPFNFPGTTFHTAMRARQRIAKLLSGLISERRREMEFEGGKPNSREDMISAFLALRDENGEPLPEGEMIDNFITLVIASHDTTTIVLIMFLRILARDPEVRSKVLEEQEKAKKAKEENGGKLRWSEIQMMKYTWRVAQEIMRMTPPVFGNFKGTSRDTSFNGFDIPKGWKVMWVASPTHMEENIFQDPEKFDPSRFENPTSSIPPYVYIPFGAGPRICPGAEFAKLELLLVIHNLVINYEWKEKIPNEPIRCEPVPYPVMGLPLHLHRRKNHE